MRHIGFTGTRHGMTPEQYCKVIEILGERTEYEYVAHHGDCIGADADFHRIAYATSVRIVGHIPEDNTHRAFCEFHEVRSPLPHMKRNKAIVAESDVMIATPLEMTEQERGGTWKTIGFTRKAGKPLAIVWRDGTVSKERWP